MSLHKSYHHLGMFGPFCFPRYTSPIGKICEKHGVMYHLYADDTQLYVVFDLDKADEAKAKLEACIEELRQWLLNNKLKLNDEKTEYVLIGTPHFSRNAPDFISTIQVGTEIIKASPKARNIGAIVDSNLNMEGHISSITSACYLHLRSIGSIRKYLTKDATISLVHAFITNKLDNLNALLINTFDYNTAKLQKIQNQAARIVNRIKKRDWLHMTPVLCDLHWLPIKFRTEFKICLLVFKCLHGLAPGYLAKMIKWYRCNREGQRSESQNLVVKFRKKKTSRYGDRAFQVCGPRLWDTLPDDVRKCTCVDTFKGKLKTHLFKRAFNV